MHHANVLIGNIDWALTVIPPEYGSTHVDVRLCVYERMSIADARAIIEEARLRPVKRSVRSFVLAAKTLPIETQNALLKIFEDPNEHALFFLVVPRFDMLIPTLKSRLFVYAQEADRVDGSGDFKDFLALHYGGRIEKILQKTKENDDAWVAAIVEGAETHFRNTRNQKGLEDVLDILGYLSHQGSSKKMLLEHLALTLEESLL